MAFLRRIIMTQQRKMVWLAVLVLALLLVPANTGSGGGTIIDKSVGMSIVESYGKLPLSFEANKGQTDPEVKFLSRGIGYTLFLAPTEAVLALQKAATSNPQQKSDRVHTALGPEAARAQAPAVLRMKLVGSNPAPRLVGLNQLPGKSNYFIGNNPKKWRTNVPNYSKVRYENVYAGVDLIYYGSQGQLEYDFVVAPGAAPGAITLGLEGAEGMAIDPQGNLVLSIGSGEVSLHKPVVYQEVDGVRREIQGGYVLKEDNRVGFQVAAYDAGKPLVIDPTLAYSTYLGGSDTDRGFGIAVDSGGNAYVTGLTISTNFPTASPFQAACGAGGCEDAFVTKFNPTGSALVYSTYLGGSGNDRGFGIAVDGGGNAYVAGGTNSTNFPTASPFQAARGGGFDAFVTKLNPTGSALVYSTYLGGSGGTSQGVGIAVDSSGNAYVTGNTNSANFPTASSFQAALSGPRDAFVTKFNPAGSALVYSTYLGGSGDDDGGGIAVDSSGNAYVTGNTNSANFPTASPFQAAPGGGFDAFVSKLNPTGSALVYSTYLGGNGGDFGSGIAVDSSGNAYVAGATASTNFPTASPFQAALGGGFDAFVTKLNAAGSALVFSTYLGGSAGDGGSAIALDVDIVYVTGDTASTNFPTANAIQAAFGGGTDGFVAKLDIPDLVFATYLGGSGDDSGASIAVDSGGNAYVTGETASTDFPTMSPFQAAFGGGTQDAFVTKIGAAGVCPGAPGGIISWWPGEGNAQDIVSHFDGTLQNGATFGTGIVGQDFSLDGIDDAIVVNNNAALNPASITVEAWVKPNSVPAGTIAAVVTKWGFDATVDSYFLGLLNSGGVVSVLGAIGDGATGDSGFSGGTVTLNTWNHIAMTYDAASDLNRLYLNGVSVGQRVRANGIFPTTTSVFIGREDSNNNRFFSGLIDEPTIYSRALTDAEILAIFNAGGNGKCGASPSGADLTVTKGGAPNPVIEGDNLTYTLNVANNGPSGATSVTLTDPLPTGVTFVSATPAQGTCSNAGGTVTCNLGSMASAAQVAVTIVGRPTGAASLSNTASVTATESDPNPANNSATATGTALGFTLSNTSGTVTVNAGETGKFTIRATPGAGGFPNAITLSSSNVPATLTGSFNTTSATPGNSPVDVVFSLATTAPASAPPHRIPVQRPWPIVPLVGVSALMLLWALLRHQEPRLRRQAIVPLGALLAASLAGCNGNHMATGGTPAGTYNVTVTATSGTASHTTTATLVVR